MNVSSEELAALEKSLLKSQEELKEIINTVWLLGCAALVYFMQAGFALVEVGSCRINHALSILVKNQVDFLVSCLGWYLIGWGLSFGDAVPTAGVAGTSQFLGGAVTDGPRLAESALVFHFQQMFCTVAATIVSGGIAERADLKGYVIFTFVLSTVIYPLVVCWCWNGDGWLASMGFSDFAGSGVVHLTGGMGALAGSWVLGPRIGRFDSEAGCHDSHEFQPHNVPFIALGTMVLNLGWYAFNAGSVLSLGSEADSKLAVLASVNTTMAAIAGGVVSTIIRLCMTRRWDVPYACNGVLAGLVSVTASCHAVNPPSAIAIGCVGGAAFCLAFAALHKLHIDDPVGAFPVHGVSGIWGVLAGSLFHRGADVLGTPEDGPDFSIQLLGASAICGFTGLSSLLVFWVLKKTGVLGTSIEDQRKGLDRKFGEHAYGSKEVSRYRFFVSHAKSTHGATARWVQLELARYAKGKSHVFLDSDNLVNLSNLLGTVRDKVDVLVVLATRDIWWRPWCAGEIAVASAAGVPIVLLMVQEGDATLELDFFQIASQVRHNISPDELEALAPFGIGYEDIERAYSRLSSRPQVTFGPFSKKQTKRAMSQVASLAEPSSGKQVSLRMTDSITSWRSKAKPNYLVICDCQDIEAVAASHVCERAMLEVANQDPEFRVASCAGMLEPEVLQRVSAGATLIIVLSRHALESPFVQRVCLVRAAALWPDGFAGCSDTARAEIAVAVNAENLGFQYPSSDFYKRLHVIHEPNLPSTSGRTWSRCSSDAASIEMSASNSVKLSVTLSTWKATTLSSTRLPYQDDEQVAIALSSFYRVLFQPIAMPLATHGSWKIITQQMESVCERARKLPRVLRDKKPRSITSKQRHETVDIDWELEVEPGCHRTLSA